MSEERFDVAVAGAGPAGAAAAIYLARSHCRVALIDRITFPRSALCAGWLNVRAVPLLEEMGVCLSEFAEDIFREVTFHNADFTKKAVPSFKDAPGYLIDRTVFDNGLVETAVRAGAQFLAGREVTDVHLGENEVTLDLAGGAHVRASLLVLATGRSSPLLERIGFGRDHKLRPIWSAQLDEAIEPETDRKPAVSIVLGLDRGGGFGLICTARRRISIGINWTDAREDALPALAKLCRGAYAHRLVPRDYSSDAAAARLVTSPASAALDMESHVGKHTLVIGDAGGFVCAVSNEGIYPAVWSAKIAARVVADALADELSQDQLMTFNSRWRMEMAEYLRPPHADVQFLLPLIFSNQPMADRMGAAFFSGENI